MRVHNVVIDKIDILNKALEILKSEYVGKITIEEKINGYSFKGFNNDKFKY